MGPAGCVGVIRFSLLSARLGSAMVTAFESDILPTTTALQPDETEDSSMLQLPPVPLLSHHTPVTLSLDATIPPVPANDLHDVGYPELLFS